MSSIEQRARRVYQQDLGLFLKDKREAADLSQWDVAKKCKLTSPQFISNIERGTCAVPSAMLRKLIKLYSIDKSEILTFLVDLKMEYHQKSLFGGNVKEKA